jgi:hypothetical protein
MQFHNDYAFTIGGKYYICLFAASNRLIVL